MLFITYIVVVHGSVSNLNALLWFLLPHVIYPWILGCIDTHIANKWRTYRFFTWEPTVVLFQYLGIESKDYFYNKIVGRLGIIWLNYIPYTEMFIVQMFMFILGHIFFNLLYIQWLWNLSLHNNYLRNRLNSHSWPLAQETLIQ